MHAGLLEEYRALRAEILAINSRIDGIDKTMAPLVAAGLGATFIVRSAELPLIMSLLVCSFWHDEQYWLGRMVNLGVYISLMIEPKVPGLAWESALNRGYPRHEPTSFWHYVGILLSHYPVVYLLCLASAVLVKCCYEPSAAASGPVFYILGALSLGAFGVDVWRATRYSGLRDTSRAELCARQPVIDAVQAEGVASSDAEQSAAGRSV